MSWVKYIREAKDVSTADFTVMQGRIPLTCWHVDPELLAAGRGPLLRDFAAELSSGDGLLVGQGNWDFGTLYWLLPAGIKVFGWGKGRTRLICSQENQAGACGFELQRGVDFSDMSLTWRSKDSLTRGGQTVGIARRDAPNMIVAKLTNVEVYSYGGAAFYIWGGGKGHVVAMADCDFYAGRWGVAIGSGSADDSATLNMLRCRVFVDFGMYGGAGGDMGTPGNTTGLLLRGGKATFTQGVVTVTAFPGDGSAGPNGPPFPLVIGAATSSLGSNQWPNLPVYGNGVWPHLIWEDSTVKLNGRAPLKSLDLWGQIGKIDVYGGSGSGPNGTYLHEGNVNFLAA